MAMKIIETPESFHRRMEVEMGRPLEKRDTYFPWLDGVARGGGPAPTVPLGVIARANEEVRAEFGYESYAAVSEKLASWGFEYDRRNVKARVTQCSGFPLAEVRFWADRSPVTTSVIPPDHERFVYWAAQRPCLPRV